MRLPSLKNVEAFEAAAKHLNFTRAGEELNITSAAVSQRVAGLEESLGYRLFLRSGPKLELTDNGMLCLPLLSRALLQMREAVSTLEDVDDISVLTIRASPSFVNKWLIPKLVSFTGANRETDLRILGTSDRIDIEEGERLAAIFYGIEPGQGLAENLAVDRLIREDVFPVCSPDYAATHGPFEALDDLRRIDLLHDETMKAMQSFPTWQRWCENFDLEGVEFNRGLRFRVSELAVEAAVAGLGMALGRGALVRKDIEAGRLVRPFSQIYPLSFDYLLVYPRILNQRPDFQKFRAWILEEAKRYESEQTQV